MTPRRLDPEVIAGKLRAMRRLLRELDRLGPVDADRFAREYATQLVVERIVSQLAWSTWRRASTPVSATAPAPRVTPSTALR